MYGLEMYLLADTGAPRFLSTYSFQETAKGIVQRAQFSRSRRVVVSSTAKLGEVEV